MAVKILNADLDFCFAMLLSMGGQKQKLPVKTICATQKPAVHPGIQRGAGADLQVSSPNSKKTQCSIHANFIMCSEKVVCDDAW